MTRKTTLWTDWTLLTSTDLAYIAGIIDGEGTILIYNVTSQSNDIINVKVSIDNTSKPMLDWFGKKLGVIVSVPHTPSQANHKQVYRIEITGKKAKELVQLIYPYLVSKVEQAKLALEFPIVGKGYRTTEETRLEQAILYIRMSKLNKKGVENELSN